MTDITFAVAFYLAAISASLMFAKRGSIEVARIYVYSATVIFGMHAFFGVVITAPLASAGAEALSIFGFAWLITATLALIVRGANRVIADRSLRPNGSFSIAD